MKSTRLSEKSADSYAGALKGRLNNLAISHQITKKQLANITDLPEFVAVAEQLRQTPEFKDRNSTGKGMYAAALSNYQKYLSALGAGTATKTTEYGPHQRQVIVIEAEHPEFAPKGRDDARARVLRAVVQRRGQQTFRKALIAAYGGRCAITGCSVLPLLEAAHITPYLGPYTNAITNGLLLRAGIHTLSDLGLMAVEASTKRIWVSPDVNDPTYTDLSGRALTPPKPPTQQPSTAALLQQWNLVRKSSVPAGIEA
ncbi:HNH endonuclease [Massilia sp. CT11-137]|uniref:HNH endonuclease n=1 Tax=Massilia sp. CT11-137 TaxID=3393901 RepID=UPI0039AEC5EB